MAEPDFSFKGEGEADGGRNEKQAQYKRDAYEPRWTEEMKGTFVPDLRRIELVDEIRGMCVLAMVAYHSFFILGSQFGVEWGTRLYEFFRPAQPAFAAMFILIAGFCARLSRDVRKRGFLLAAIAVGITLVSVLLLPYLGFGEMQVWFGIIHLLAASTLLFALGRKLFDKIPTLMGVLLCLALFFVTAPVSQGYLGMLGFRVELPEALYRTNALAFLGFHTPAFEAFDHFPLLPYFFIFLFGTFMGKLARNEKKQGQVRKENLPEFCYKKHMLFFGFLGRRALLAYLLHVPVFYGLGYFLQLLFNIGKP